MGNGEHTYGPLDLLHFDVRGPLSINARWFYLLHYLY